MTADPAQPDDRPTALSSLIPRSSSFELGWVMAQLFDPRRFEPLNTRTFNPSIQLPMTSNLDPAERQKVAIAQLHTLIRPLPRVTDKRILLAAATRPFDRARFDEEIRSFHLALLEAEVASFAELSAYHLGIALSDLCWTHTPDRGPDSFLRAFGRGELAELQVLLRASSEVLPPLTAATVNKSLEAWGDWTDVTAGVLMSGWASVAAPVLTALRVQGDIWHQLLSVQTVDDDEADPGPARAAVGRQFFLIIIVAALAATVLYLTIANFGGAAKVWTVIATITAALGVSGASLMSSARKAANAFGWNRQTTVKAEARVWSVTLFPAIPMSQLQRRRLDRRGVTMSRIRRNLDV